MEEESGRNRNKGSGLEAGGWETIYSSLALILVALFGMLVSYSTVEGDKLTNFMRGFAAMATSEGRSSSSEGDVKSLIMEGGRDSVSKSMAVLKKYFTSIGLAKSIDIERTEQGFRTTFGSTVLFASGEAALRQAAYPYIDQIIDIARDESYSVRVEGHTDDVPIHTPRFSSNWELSTARAVTVLRYMLADVPAQRLSAVGFGQYRPLMSNGTDEGRRINRRVDFYFNLDEDSKSQ